jgi:hypothetical protein
LQTYKLQHLTGRKLRVFLAVASRIVPADEHDPGAGTMATAGVVDWAMNRLDPDLRALFLKFLVAVDVMGVAFGGRTFCKNSPAAQDKQLRWLENCPIRKFRMGFFGLKSYVCMGYYTRETVWQTFDYGGPMVEERPFPDNTIRLLEQERLQVVK